jgi:hypothetical protein
VRVQNRFGAIDEFHERTDATAELEQLLLAVALIDQLDANAIVQEGQLAQALGQDVVVELDVSEHLGAGAEVHLGAATLRRSDFLQRRDAYAVAELHLVHVSTPAVSRSHSERAFTTDTPTPCSPPEIL